MPGAIVTPSAIRTRSTASARPAPVPSSIVAVVITAAAERAAPRTRPIVLVILMSRRMCVHDARVLAGAIRRGLGDVLVAVS